MKDEIIEIMYKLKGLDDLSTFDYETLLKYITNLHRNNCGNEVKATNQKIKIKELEKRIVKLKDNITNLQQENKDLKETIKSINAISYQSDDEIWLNVRHDIEDLDEFASDIDHYIAPYITYNYKSHIRAIIKYLVRFFKQHCAYKR